MKRVAVEFTAGQKAEVVVLVEAGDFVGAGKLILVALEKASA